ncbi:MAG: sigma-70 family RNA polymerase sigma factor, partial [Clostridia bacterium]|nr:sigma-70 family RNA polymerase sigma factor [Clostridia bacterium]
MYKVTLLGIDASKLPRLKRAESDALLKLIKEGDEQAKNLFITANMRLVLSIIKRFSNAKCSADDMFQAGCMGLIKATDNFDLSVGVAFSTYAVPMILGEIKRLIRSNSGIRVSRSLRDTAYQVLKTRSELEKKGEEVTPKVIANKLNVLESEVVYALDAISDTVSLYDPVYSKEGEELLLVDQIKDEKENDDRWAENLALFKATEKLEEREKKI